MLPWSGRRPIPQTKQPGSLDRLLRDHTLERVTLCTSDWSGLSLLCQQKSGCCWHFAQREKWPLTSYGEECRRTLRYSLIGRHLLRKCLFPSALLARPEISALTSDCRGPWRAFLVQLYIPAEQLVGTLMANRDSYQLRTRRAPVLLSSLRCQADFIL